MPIYEFKTTAPFIFLVLKRGLRTMAPESFGAACRLGQGLCGLYGSSVGGFRTEVLYEREQAQWTENEKGFLCFLCLVWLISGLLERCSHPMIPAAENQSDWPIHYKIPIAG